MNSVTLGHMNPEETEHVFLVFLFWILMIRLFLYKLQTEEQHHDPTVEPLKPQADDQLIDHVLNQDLVTSNCISNDHL